MTFCLKELKSKYDQSGFFTSNRECIEYLLLENLQPLEEYALLVFKGEAWIFSSHLVKCQEVKLVQFEGYSNCIYQNKIKNIITKLDEFCLPAKIETVLERQIFSDYFQKRRIAVEDITASVQEDACIKTSEQLEAIENCVKLDEKLFQSIMQKETGRESEISLFRYIQECMVEETGFPNSIIYDFVAGERTAEVSGFPTGYRMREKDTIIADLLPRHCGVYADMTRTFFAGQPTAKQTAVYEILCEAMSRAEEILKPGVEARTVYEQMYSVFQKNGWEKNFLHHAGHGLGMGYFEAPYFLKNEPKVLEENMVVALEPGLYFAGEFGIRIENDYVITNKGVKRLGTLPVTMESYILKYYE